MPEKAEAYFNALHMPVFSCDSGSVFFDNVAEDDQPWRPCADRERKYLSDEEMTAALRRPLQKSNGGLTGRYKTQFR